MSMVKKGITTRSNIDVIGSSDSTSYICENCKKIVTASTDSESAKKCPFCGTIRENSIDINENITKET